EEEKEILRRMSGADEIRVSPVVTPEEILAARRTIAGLYLDEAVGEYILDLVTATREPKRFGLGELEPLIEFGASPRATIALAVCSRAHAFLRGRAYVAPEDVKAIGADVLRHRVITTYEAEAEEVTPDDIVRRVFEAVRVP
ncbi:MAG TPA: MoxR family ATPase, partial [Longimicrobiaceae bacterium]